MRQCHDCKRPEVEDWVSSTEKRAAANFAAKKMVSPVKATSVSSERFSSTNPAARNPAATIGNGVPALDRRLTHAGLKINHLQKPKVARICPFTP